MNEKNIINAKRLLNLNDELIKIQKKITSLITIQQNIIEELLTTQSKGEKK